MKVYAKSLLVGLCAAAVVVVGCWRLDLIPQFDYTPARLSNPSVRPTSRDDLTVETIEDVGTVTVTTAPWHRYVALMAGLALVTASGWQLRRSWRGR